VQGSDIWEYTYPAGKLLIRERCIPALFLGGTGGALRRGGVGSGDGWLHQLDGEAPNPFRLQHI
jgi:hypothetical protein